MIDCPISVVIPTYQRSQDLMITLEKIFACDPYPQEVIIHVDYGDSLTPQILEKNLVNYPNLKILQGDRRVGPGGGRNKAIWLAKNEIVASFDDDSYPLDGDYFARLLTLFNQFPEVAVIGATIYHRNETIEPENYTARWEHSFVGCGCAYRKQSFLDLGGYVELPLAYGMEEVDLSLRLYNQGWKVLMTPWLRVFHDTNLDRHGKPTVTAATISNQMLLTYLRYPLLFWWVGIGQTFSRILWLVRHRRMAGILLGIRNIPYLIYQHRQARSVVSPKTLQDFLRLKRRPLSLSLDKEYVDG